MLGSLGLAMQVAPAVQPADAATQPAGQQANERRTLTEQLDQERGPTHLHDNSAIPDNDALLV